MTTLRVEIEEYKDISVLQKVLTELGFKFSLENEEDLFEDISQAELFGIGEGLKDLEAGRVAGHEQARSIIDKKIEEMRIKYSGH
ncbi:hypothetical protein [Dyadobacter arcticus]|uniref:Uncharacterized protein n=1 Tax=Dyadobacter arcticus TaxID=1078754 RepID=A0ABX0URT8_9BACT|nr:hypothetical protein [Dyadobacter arcticus]NIJ55703.1 hypothetical protein [Dyadobacter arcticus]